MLESQRKEKLLSFLQESQVMTTTALARNLFVSEATIRRDLSELEKAGLVYRVHGGARAVSGMQFQIPLSSRDRKNDIPKQNIAAKAAKLLKNGDTIFLDASSTVFRLIPLLSEFTGLTVITNSPKAALKLAELHISTLSTGGQLLEESVAFVGYHAEKMIQGMNADVMFFSCRGITDEGWVCDSSPEETAIRKEMLQHAKKKYLLCDEGKIGRTYPFNICHRRELDGVITENGYRR